MAYDFNGTTDRIDWAGFDMLAGLPYTLSAWVNTPGATSNVFHVVDHHLTGDSALGHIMYLDTNDKLHTFINRSTTGADYRSTNAIPLNQWVHCLVTHNGDLVDTGDFTIYIDGVSETVFQSNAGTGTQVNATGSMSVGGRIYDDARNFDGQIAEVAEWGRVLTAGEAAALAAGYSPALFPDGLQFYAPLERSTIDLLGGAATTVDGGTVSSHPAVINLSAYKITSQVSRYAYNGPLIQQFRPQTNIPPSSALATQDSYAAQTGQRNVLDFDGSAQDESGSWQFQMPSWYDGSGLLVETLTSMDGTDGDPVRLKVGIGRNDDDTPGNN